MHVVNERKTVSIVIPVFNEELGLKGLLSKLTAVGVERSEEFKFIFVDDGSTDNSLSVLLRLRAEDDRVSVIELTRNFGQHKALMAGMRESKGDCVILMDADLEDSPKDISMLLDKWTDGYDVVYAIRRSRQTNFFRTKLFKYFHAINKRVSMGNIEAVGTFGLMDRKVVDEVVKLKEHSLYLPGVRNWVGYEQVGVELDRGSRYDKKSHVSLFQLYKLAFDSFASSSDKLLSIPLFIGVILVLISFASMIVVIALRFFTEFGPWGWPSMISILLFLFGIQFAFIGLIGEFITRILVEVRDRPLFIIRNIYR